MIVVPSVEQAIPCHPLTIGASSWVQESPVFVEMNMDPPPPPYSAATTVVPSSVHATASHGPIGALIRLFCILQNGVFIFAFVWFSGPQRGRNAGPPPNSCQEY